MIKLSMVFKNILVILIIWGVVFVGLEVLYRVYRIRKYHKEVQAFNHPLIEPLGLNNRLEYAYKPNSEFETKNGVTYKINSKGLRDKEFSYKKPSDTIRILVLGDSFTFGWMEPLENTYPKLLESILNKEGNLKYEVINAGVYGYNTTQEYEFLKREGIKYNPDLAILGFVVNDAEPQNTTPINPYYEMERAVFWFPEFIKFRLNILFEKKFGKNNFFKLKQKQCTEHLWESFVKDEYSWKAGECFQALTNIRDLLDKKRTPLLVVMFPSLDFQKGIPVVPYAKYEYFKPIHDTVKDFCKKENINFLETYPYFEGECDVIQLSVHLNRKGYLIAAKAIAKYMGVNFSLES